MTTTIRAVLVTLLVLGAGAPAGAEPFCSRGKDATCANSNCDAGGFALDVVDKLCSLAVGSGCLDICACCRTGSRAPENDLFSGVTLGPPSGGGTPFWCRSGGRGQLMGEAAVCLLRDIGRADVGSESRLNIGIGDARIRQKLGLLSFAPADRRLEGFHGVDICVPVFGCVDNLTQKFTADLGATPVPFGTPDCGDYPLESAYGLLMRTDDVEHALDVEIKDLIQIPTPYGETTISPKFFYTTATKTVTMPWGSPAQALPGRGESVPGFTEKLLDVLDPLGGVPLSIGRPEGGGWNSQLALGGRAVDPMAMLFPGQLPGSLGGLKDNDLRPDRLSNGVPRNEDEKARVAEGGAEIEVRHDLLGILPKEVRDLIDAIPFLSIPKFEVFVTPGVRASFASQFRLELNEIDFQNIPGPRANDLGPTPTSVLLETGTNAEGEARIDTGLNLHLRFRIPLLFTTIQKTVRIEPRFPIPLADSSDSSPWDGPIAEAATEITPEDPVDFTRFRPFSAGGADVDGVAFIEQCLSEPPPPVQEVPQPVWTPGDPNPLIERIQWPCNVCAYLREIRTVCAPKEELIAQGETDFPCTAEDTDLVINEPCPPAWEDRCRSVTPKDGPLVVNLTQPLFGASQADLPAGKQWVCDGFQKAGCYDLCSYDPEAPERLRVVTSAVDNPDGGDRCAGPPESGARSCDTAADCDDLNPCTTDSCFVQQPRSGGPRAGIGQCLYRPADGACDDGVFCNGADTCAAGQCAIHDGNPCTGDPLGSCCNEGTDACQQSCAAVIPTCTGADGTPCDTGTPCSTGGVCIAGICRGQSRCDDSNRCTDDFCEVRGAGDVTCRHNENGTCPAGCGDGQLGPGEECDGADDAACPGACRFDCSCTPEECGTGLDEDGDGLIDCADPDCPTQGCQCQPIGRDPGSITGGRGGDLSSGRLKLHGSITPCGTFDPAAEEVALVLSDASGVVASFTLPPGSLTARGPSYFLYRDRQANRDRAGVAKLIFKERRRGEFWEFRFQGYGDLARAGAQMTTQVRIGDAVFVNAGTWRPTRHGWELVLPGERP